MAVTVKLRNDRPAKDPDILAGVAPVLMPSTALQPMQAVAYAATRSAAENFPRGPVVRLRETNPVAELSPARHPDAPMARRIRTGFCARRPDTPPAGAVRSGERLM